MCILRPAFEKLDVNMYHISLGSALIQTHHQKVAFSTMFSHMGISSDRGKPSDLHFNDMRLIHMLNLSHIYIYRLISLLLYN